LYFYKARFYDSTLGRFLSADTLTPGGPEGLNRYAYANNSPINFNDPSGHCVGAGGHDFPDGSPACGEEDTYIPPTPTSTPTPTTTPTPTPTPTPSTLSPEEKDYLDGIFNPFIGPGFTSGQRKIDYTEWISFYDLYESMGIDINLIASRGKDNPLSFEEIRDLGAGEPIVLLSRARYTPYTLFLIKAARRHSVYDLGNFEPFYLEALMNNFPNALAEAKKQYFYLYKNEYYEYKLQLQPNVVGD
jgi:hypothetical protein